MLKNNDFRVTEKWPLSTCSMPSAVPTADGTVPNTKGKLQHTELPPKGKEVMISKYAYDVPDSDEFFGGRADG